jgi:hypothetical protein
MLRAASCSVVLVVVAAGGASAQDPPDLRGTWRLDSRRSDDAAARIAEVAGPAQLTGGGASGLTILPELNTRSEVERLELRAWMMSIAERLARLEIDQTPDEVKLYLGDEVRIFYLAREHVRQDSRGQKLKASARLEGGQLILQELGDKGLKLVEVLTPVPSAGWLIHAVRFEHSLLKKPLDLRLVYVREEE